MYSDYWNPIDDGWAGIQVSYVCQAHQTEEYNIYTYNMLCIGNLLTKKKNTTADQNNLPEVAFTRLFPFILIANFTGNNKVKKQNHNYYCILKKCNYEKNIFFFFLWIIIILYLFLPYEAKKEGQDNTNHPIS